MSKPVEPPRFGHTSPKPFNRASSRSHLWRVKTRCCGFSLHRAGQPERASLTFEPGSSWTVVETHVVNIPAKATRIPDAVDEGSLSKSANKSIPGSIIQPGLEMVVEVDPQGRLDPGLGVEKRIPVTGRATIDVREMPTFNLTVVPFLWSPKPDSLVLDITRAMAKDPRNHGLLGQTRTLLPVGDFLLTAHEPVLTSYNTANRLIEQTDLIRVMEGGHGHYLGTMTGEFEGVDGSAYPYGRTTFSKTDGGDRSEYVIAHELGHNMGLQHTPGCGAALADYTFPHPNGVIGAWGYDFEAERLVSPDTGDLMSYCHRDLWISEFHRTNALRYRLADEGGSADVVTAPVRSLLLWGGVDDFGVPFLEPSFVVDAPPTMPAEGGEYRLTGSGADGDALFSFSFGMQEIADRDGSRSFAFALPVEPGWAGRLSAITLSRPDRSVRLDEASDRPMLILRDPVTGQVRGILRGPAAQAEVQFETAALPANPRLETLYTPRDTRRGGLETVGEGAYPHPHRCAPTPRRPISCLALPVWPAAAPPLPRVPVLWNLSCRESPWGDAGSHGTAEQPNGGRGCSMGCRYPARKG